MISVHIRILSFSTHLSPREQEGSHSHARNKVITRNQTYHHPGPSSLQNYKRNYYVYSIHKSMVVCSLRRQIWQPEVEHFYNKHGNTEVALQLGNAQPRIDVHAQTFQGPWLEARHSEVHGSRSGALRCGRERAEGAIEGAVDIKILKVVLEFRKRGLYTQPCEKNIGRNMDGQGIVPSSHQDKKIRFEFLN